MEILALFATAALCIIAVCTMYVTARMAEWMGHIYLIARVLEQFDDYAEGNRKRKAQGP